MLIDSHSHLDMKAFNGDRNQVIDRARETGVSAIINIGLDIKTSEASIRLAERHPEISATVGFHPHEASKMGAIELKALEELTRHPSVTAIGEIGLDFYRNRSPKEAQLRTFQQQLELASEVDLPVVIHCREAQPEVMAMLEKWVSQRKQDSCPPGVIHCFNGEGKAAGKYLDMGFYLSFTATITYPSSYRFAEDIRNMPRERILIETDCPFLPPQTQRGKRNEPAYVVYTARRLANIWNLPAESVQQITAENTLRLFKLRGLPSPS